MKKLSLLLALMCFVALARAQSSTYRAFKVDLGLGYAIPSGNSNGGTKAGVTFTVEPHYRFSDALAVGMRVEGAGLGYEQNVNGNNTGGNGDFKISVLSSYCPTVELYLMNGGFRPLIGAGAGIFSQSSAVYNANSGSNTDLVKDGTKFGFFPRAGFEAGHFRMTAEYNILGNNSSYVAFKIGAFFGGGKK